MIKKELIGLVPETKKYIVLNIGFQWLGLVANIVMMYNIALLLAQMIAGAFSHDLLLQVLVVCVGCILSRMILLYGANRMAYLSSKQVKDKLRKKIYQKLLHLQGRYEKILSTAQIVQVTNEGVEQLETYFGAYLPQFFYAILAPITLFVVFSFFDWTIGLVLLIGVWLIPVSIVLVQRWAKKLLSRYWDQYTTMGDTFLENLQGLTTLKIYQADEYRHQLMNKEAEKFRKITMKVLIMQLNSISIMDLVSYGGAALGMLIAIAHLQDGSLTLMQGILVILLAADFFLPMRTLGSFFHIAMNGMAASDKIFKILAAPNPAKGGLNFELGDYCLQDVSYSYDGEKKVLDEINVTFKSGELSAIVGESGSGKSTLAALLTKQLIDPQGDMTINGRLLKEIADNDFYAHVTYLSHQSYIFKGSVRDNLQLGNIAIDDKMMWEALEKVKLAAFLRQMDGLDTKLNEKGSNLSGGQQQRLALARALLADSDIYIFDEATSNIDVESEELIIKNIYQLAKLKMVIMISHRLANVVASDHIVVMEQGKIVEQGSHQELLAHDGCYKKLWEAQKALEDGEEDEA